MEYLETISLTAMRDLITSTRRGLSSSYLNGGTEQVRLIKAKDITSEGSLALKDIDTECVKRTPAFEKARIKRGDVLVTVTGARFRAAVVLDEAEDLLISNSLIALSLDQTKIIPEFAAWYLNSQRGQMDLQKRASGAIIMSLNTALLLEVMIPVPTMEQQRQFVDLLRIVDEYRTILEQEAALLNKITESVMDR